MLEGKLFFRKKLGRGIDDTMFWPFYAFAEEKGLPITMHLMLFEDGITVSLTMCGLSEKKIQVNKDNVFKRRN